MHKRKRKEQNKNCQGQKLGLFGYVYKTGFWTEQYCLHRNFIYSDGEDKTSFYVLVLVIAMTLFVFIKMAVIFI